MPYIGRYTKYPIYPQLGSDDPTKFINTLSVGFETDLLPVGNTVNWQIKTGSAEIRFYDQLIEFFNGDVDFSIIEGATCTDGVTVVPIGSSDRNSTFVSSIFASSDPTGISGGARLVSAEHFGLRSPVFGLGDYPPNNLNYVNLRFNTNYIIRFTNVGTEDIIDLRYIALFAE